MFIHHRTFQAFFSALVALGCSEGSPSSGGGDAGHSVVAEGGAGGETAAGGLAGSRAEAAGAASEVGEGGASGEAFSAGAGGVSPNDDQVELPAPSNCVVVNDETSAPGSVLSVTPDSLKAEWDPQAGIRVSGPAGAYDEIVVQLRFEGCVDVTHFDGIGFTISSSGDFRVALDAPSNSRPPEGGCVGTYCYSPFVRDFTEGGSSFFFAWSDFENGTPSAKGDPEHVLGVTWTLEALPYRPVDTVIKYPRFYSPT